MAKVLEGVRIADFSHVFAGPFTTYFLALLGAEVVKVESIGRGDGMRNYGPDTRYHGMSPNFIAANAGKRAIAVDMKTPDGLAVAQKLVASSDVVIENFRPGAMRRMKLGYEDAKALRQDIIYCSISGYGQKGPRRDFAAIDNIVQATSGMMSIAEGPDHDPEIIGFPIVDMYTATQAALAIMAALMQRMKDGSGQNIDVAMMDSSLTILSAVLVPYMVSGIQRERKGNRGYSDSPGSGLFWTRDKRQLSLGVVQDNQFKTLCGVLARPDLLADPRYINTVERLTNGPALVEELTAEFLKDDAVAWEKKLNDAGCSAGVVSRFADVVGQEYLHERGSILPMHIPGLPVSEDVSVVNLGFQFEHDTPGISRPPPWLGEHTEEVMAELGFAADDRARMLAAGAVFQAPPRT